jgi:hypothetical protein
MVSILKYQMRLILLYLKFVAYLLLDFLNFTVPLTCVQQIDQYRQRIRRFSVCLKNLERQHGFYHQRLGNDSR